MAEQITGDIFQVGGAVYTSPEGAAIYVINRLRRPATRTASGASGSGAGREVTFAL
jgi:hypothetical protein